MNRKLAAHYIYPVSSQPIKFGTITINTKGTITELTLSSAVLDETEHTEFFNGILIPQIIVPVKSQKNNNKFVSIENINEFLKPSNITQPLVFCPSYFELNKLQMPNPLEFEKLGYTISIGTLNGKPTMEHGLFNELKILTKYFDIPFEKLLSWITLNNALAEGLQGTKGSLEIGKTPGISLIGSFNFKTMQITGQSTLKNIV